MNKTINIKNILFISVVFILSFAIKLIYVLNIPLEPIQDFETLYNVAVNLYEGKGFTLNGYEWGFQSYGYPLILSLFFRLIGSSTVFTAKIFNVIISMGTLIIFYFIFNKVFAKKSVVYISYVIMAFLPNNIIYNNVTGTEILSVCLLSLIILMNFHMTVKNRNLNLIFQGIICGLLSLVKPFFMAYPIVIIFIYFIKEKKLKLLLTFSLLLLSGFMIVLIPSIVKNYKQFNDFIPISYNGGFTLYINNNSQNTRGSWMNAFKVDATDEFKEKLKAVGYDVTENAEIEKQQNLRNHKASTVYQQEAVKWIINNPIEFITLGFMRLTNVFFSGAGDVQLWGFEAETINNFTNQEHRVFKIFIALSNTIIYILSSSFIIVLFMNFKNIFLKKTDIKVLFTVWTMAFFYAVFFVVEGQSRYNFPCIFLMMICCGILIEKFLKNKEESHDK